VNLDMHVNADNERRMYERFEAKFPARRKGETEEFGANISLLNASADGIRIEAKKALAVDEYISLEVQIPDRSMDPMNVEGTVIWIQDKKENLWNVGVKFHAVNLVHMARLYKFIEPPTEE
jgi:hypothetical protein